MAEFMKKELAGVGALIERIKSAIGIGTPVGTIIMWCGKVSATSSDFPKGYLECNGASFSQSTYPELYAVLGTTTLPDFNGRFPMGTNNTSNVGSAVNAGLPNITGTFSGVGQKFGTPTNAATLTGAFYCVNTTNEPAAGVKVNNTTNNPDKDDYFGFDASRSNNVYGKSNTVQPPAIRVRYLIKAK